MDNEKLYEDMKPKEKFEVLWAESGLADRPGAENLWQQMVALGFFEKPASIKHHSNHPGGLCEHSVCVAEAAMELCRTNHAFKKCNRNEVLAAALLHDYCKVGKYRDKGNGEYEYFDAGLVGHGEGSVIMAQQYIKLTAREIVNTWSAAEITRILRDYSEEKWAARIAQIICEHRAQKPLETTSDLVACVDAAIPKKVRMQDNGHSARRTFQALRIAVNDELDPLKKALEDMVELLNPGGHLAVLTFHSLEDRIVKQTFRRLANPCTCPPKIPVCICGKKPVVRVLGGGGIKPDAQEVERNPRARSAMLRGCEKLETQG